MTSSPDHDENELSGAVFFYSLYQLPQFVWDLKALLLLLLLLLLCVMSYLLLLCMWYGSELATGKKI